MKVLTISKGTFDYINNFRIKDVRYSRCSLHRDYNKVGDGILWAMLHAGVIASSYSKEEIEETERLKNPLFQISNGEVVLIENKEYRVRVLGNYSTCAMFDPI